LVPVSPHAVSPNTAKTAIDPVKKMVFIVSPPLCK
jgi:hypothetical protein